MLFKGDTFVDRRKLWKEKSASVGKSLLLVSIRLAFDSGGGKKGPLHHQVHATGKK